MRTSFSVSLLVHAILLVVLVSLQGFTVPARAPSAYKQKVEGKEAKILWYKFRKELPAVATPRATPDPRPLRAETRAPQAIVSAPKEAPKRTQMVWTPAPDPAPAPLTPSPNLLAIRMAMLPPPPRRAPPEVHVQLADAAPQLSANTALPTVALNTAKLPPRPFTAPRAGAPPPAKAIAVDIPATDLNVAIVGLTPSDIRAALPTAPSPATFSSGPQPRATGATSEGSAKGLSVPDLFVRGPRSATSDAIAQAYAAPTSTENLRAAMRRTQPGVEAPPPQPAVAGAGAKVSGAPDPRFNGRDVYLMAIQMPNLTSYSGSWLMWYASRTARETGLSPIAAPVAHRKVDPKYIATAAEERIEGRVQLFCVIDRQGSVSAVEVIRGLDDRLNQSARDALSKWQFYPALRDGQPIDVDVVVEIPFKLAPREPGR